MDSIKSNLRRGAGVHRWGLLCLLLLCAAHVQAQPKKVELAGYVGHVRGAVVDETTKDEGVDSLASALDVQSAAGFGLIFNYHITRTLHLEISWDEQPTKLDFIDRAADSTSTVTDLRVHHYQIGLVYNWSRSTKQPFVGMLVGWTQWEARGDYADESGFCFAPVLGYKTWMSDHFGLRVHAKVMITNVREGELFSNPDANFSFTHTQNTWATQIQIGVAVVVGK